MTRETDLPLLDAMFMMAEANRLLYALPNILGADIGAKGCDKGLAALNAVQRCFLAAEADLSDEAFESRCQEEARASFRRTGLSDAWAARNAMRERIGEVALAKPALRRGRFVLPPLSDGECTQLRSDVQYVQDCIEAAVKDLAGLPLAYRANFQKHAARASRLLARLPIRAAAPLS